MLTQYQIEREINNKLSMYGFNLDLIKHDNYIKNDFNVSNVIYEDTNVNISHLGPILPLFKNMQIEIKVIVVPTNDRIYLKIHYMYEHHCGSNGYTAEFEYNENTDKWKQTD